MRITVNDIKNIAEFTNLIQQKTNSKYKRITLFLDIDNILLDLMNHVYYENIDSFYNLITTTIDSIIYLIGNIKSLLSNVIDNYNIIIISSYAEDYSKLNLNYTYTKKTRYKLKPINVDYKIIDVLQKLIDNDNEFNTIINNNKYEELKSNKIIKFTRRMLYNNLSAIINNNIKNTIWLHIQGIETDYIIAYILQSYFNKDSLYFIISNDKDYIQLLKQENIYLYRKITYNIKNKIFLGNIKQKNINFYNKDNIIEYYKDAYNLSFDFAYDFILYHAIYGDNSDKIKSIVKEFRNIIASIFNYKLNKAMYNFFNDYIINHKERKNYINHFNDYYNAILNHINNKELISYLNNNKQFQDNIKLISFDNAIDLLFTNTIKQRIHEQLKYINSYTNDIMLINSIYKIFGYYITLPNSL